MSDAIAGLCGRTWGVVAGLCGRIWAAYSDAPRYPWGPCEDE